MSTHATDLFSAYGAQHTQTRSPPSTRTLHPHPAVQIRSHTHHHNQQQTCRTHQPQHLLEPSPLRKEKYQHILHLYTILHSIKLWALYFPIECPSPWSINHQIPDDFPLQLEQTRNPTTTTATIIGAINARRKHTSVPRNPPNSCHDLKWYCLPDAAIHIGPYHPHNIVNVNLGKQLHQKRHVIPAIQARTPTPRSTQPHLRLLTETRLEQSRTLRSSSSQTTARTTAVNLHSSPATPFSRESRNRDKPNQRNANHNQHCPFTTPSVCLQQSAANRTQRNVAPPNRTPPPAQPLKKKAPAHAPTKPPTRQPLPKGKTHNLRVEIPARANKKGPHHQKKKAKQDKFREENKSPDCPLCKASRCTATHIIAECPTSFKIQEDATQSSSKPSTTKAQRRNQAPLPSHSPPPATPMHGRWENPPQLRPYPLQQSLSEQSIAYLHTLWSQLLIVQPAQTSVSPSATATTSTHSLSSPCGGWRGSPMGGAGPGPPQ